MQNHKIYQLTTGPSSPQPGSGCCPSIWCLKTKFLQVRKKPCTVNPPYTIIPELFISLKICTYCLIFHLFHYKGAAMKWLHPKFSPFWDLASLLLRAVTTNQLKVSVPKEICTYNNQIWIFFINHYWMECDLHCWCYLVLLCWHMKWQIPALRAAVLQEVQQEGQLPTGRDHCTEMGIQNLE